MRLDPFHIDFMQGPVSIIAAVASPGFVPRAVRCLGCRVQREPALIDLFIAQTGAEALLADLRVTGSLAVVFTRPTTHQAMQVKGEGARVRPLEPGELAFVATYRRQLIDELGRLGFGDLFVQALLPGIAGDLVAARFVPGSAFLQTPGPSAGSPLSAGLSLDVVPAHPADGER